MRLARGRAPRRRPATNTSPSIASTAATIWVTASSRIGSPSRGRRTLNSTAPMAMPDQEDREDHREHVGRVAGARGEQARPGHLVAERRQAGDEGDHEGEPRSRHESGADAVAARCAGWRGVRFGRRRGVGRRGRSRPPSPPPPRASHSAATPGDRGAAGPDRERPGQAEQLDQDEARGQRPDDRPDRVRGIQPAERPAQRARPGEMAGQAREAWRPSGSSPAPGPGRPGRAGRARAARACPRGAG